MYPTERHDPKKTQNGPVVFGHDVQDDVFGGDFSFLQQSVQSGHVLVQTSAVLLLARVYVVQKALQVIAGLVEMSFVFLVAGNDHASVSHGLLLTTAGLLLGSHGNN
jgi:hypothetical protein